MSEELERPHTWWNAHEYGKEPHKLVIEQLDYFKQHQASRYEEMRRYVTVHEYGFRAGWSKAGARHILVQESRLAPNHAQHVVKSITTEVAAADLLVQFSPKRGSIIRDQLADDASTLAEGLLEGLGFQKLRRRLPTDFATCSIGFVRPGRAGDSLFLDRLLPDDVYFDLTELRYGQPQSIFIETWIDRWVCMERYASGPDKSLFKGEKYRALAIRRAKAGAPNGESTDGRMGDRIRLVEAYHLPSAAGATKDNPKNGRYVACVDTGTMVSRPYLRPRHEVFWYVPVPSHQGVHGIPTMRNLAAMQREHEKVSARIQRGQQKMNGNHIVLFNGATLNEEKTGNEFGDIWEVDGTSNDMHELTLTPIHPQAYEYRDGLKREMHEVESSSLSVASGQMPQGIRDVTGVAMAEMKESHTQARVEWFTAMEELTEGLILALFDNIAEMIEEGRDLSEIRALLDVAEYEELDIKEIVTKVKNPRIKAFAIPGLSQDLSQRMVQLSALSETGKLPNDIVLRLMRWQTLRPETDLQVADIDMIDSAVMHIVTTGKYMGPEAHDKFPIWIDRVSQWLDHFRANKARIRISEERMNKVRQLRDEAAVLEAAKSRVVAPGQGGQGVAPSAPGGAPPPMPPQQGSPPPGAAPPTPGMGQ